MSLLMDALRKAEEEKRRAALEGKGEATGTTTTSSEADHLASTFPPETDTAATASGTGEHSAENLRLEPLDSEATGDTGGTTGVGSVTAGSVTTTTEGSAEAFGDTTRIRLTAAQRDVFDALGVPRRNEATGTFETMSDPDLTIPSKRMLKKSLEEYFEPTRSMEGKKADAPGAAERPAMTVDSGPITAQTVFSAKRRGGSNTLFSAAASLLLLAAAGLGAVGAYHWYTQSHLTRVVPSPSVAQTADSVESRPKGEEFTMPALPPVAPAGAGSPAEPATPPVITPTAVPEEAVTGAQPSSGEAVATSQAPGPVSALPPAGTAPVATSAPTATMPPITTATAPSEAAAPMVEGAPAPPPTETAAAADAAPATTPAPATTTVMTEPPSQASIDELQTRSTARPKSSLPAPRVSSALDATILPGNFHIARAPSTQPIVPGQVLEAYEAYQQGDYNRAETLYRAAVTRYPNNRDAQLGVAALSWRRGDRAAAAGIYDRLLQSNPNDITARSALLTLQKDKNPVVDESSVKLLMQRDPNSSSLRFTLGNIYARQQRWSDAQQAYFEALARDKTNPDVAFNLAVSLDNLGARTAALDYYRKAVELAGSRPAQFTAADVQSRIHALGSSSGSAP